MAGLDSRELAEKFQDDRFRRAFVKCYAFRQFLFRGLKPADWEAPEELAEVLVLTPSGDRLLTRLEEEKPAWPESERKFAIFLAFYWNDLFIDVQATDLDRLRAVVSSLLTTGDVRIPASHDRSLQDRFAAVVGVYTEELPAGESWQILEGTPQGVAQLGSLVAGPLGVLESREHRQLPPRPIGPLLPCTDPGCSALHPVRLTDPSRCSEAATLVDDLAEPEWPGGASAWSVFFDDLAVDPPPYMDDMTAARLPLLLENSFSETELGLVCQTVLEQAPSIREQLSAGGATELASTRPDAVVDSLKNGQERLQFLLVASNEALVSALEWAIDERVIHIPSTSTRSVLISRGDVDAGWFDVMCDASRAGVRFVPRRLNAALPRLRRLILHLYSEGEQQELDWKLRHTHGNSIEAKVEQVIRQSDPRGLLRDLVMTSHERVKRATEFLKRGRFDLGASEEAEELLLDRMLWKLGFPSSGLPDHLPRFHRRIDHLLQVVRATQAPHGEQEKEEIRSAGVNVFVSLEEALDHSLSFAAWALLSDHWAHPHVTRFNFTLGDAREFMVSQVAGRPIGNGETLQLDPAGKNTLFALVQGFTELAAICNEVRDEDWSQFERAPEEIPGWSKTQNYLCFPSAITRCFLT